MNNEKDISTLDTYNRSAKNLADKFNKTGVRSDNIRHDFSFFPDPRNVKVLEIGCGNGRDAAEILKYTDQYTGLDYSEGMLSLAKKHLPDIDFILADFEKWECSDKFDMVFAFASLVHIPRDRMGKVLEKIGSLMNLDGIFHLSLKYEEEYYEEMLSEDIGDRFFAYYNPAEISRLIPDGFLLIASEIKDVRGRRWIDMIYKNSN